ncbi:MAG: SRPBCC family protein [Cyclobacteriaceae bacterium]
MIEITVSQVLEFPKEAIFRVLQNYGEYPTWWPMTVRIPFNTNDYFEFSPLPSLSIGQEESWVVENTEVELSYRKGPFRGTGTWCLEEANGQCTELSYEVRLKPVNWLIKLVAQTSFFRSKHRRDILKIISALEKYISDT